MIRLDRVIVVEGKYDKIRLESFIDALIIPTDGFGIFKNRELMSLLRRLADSRGLIILTDSDAAGFMIRSHIAGSVGQDKIINVYVPEIKGRERRKTVDSAEGLLGVEGLSEQVLTDALRRAGVLRGGEDKCDDNARRITKYDLYELGLYGRPNSDLRRKALLKKLSLPSRIGSNQLPEVLNALFSYDDLIAVLKDGDADGR